MGRKVVPGITKAPQPTEHPKANAQTANGDRYDVLFLFICNLELITIKTRLENKKEEYAHI